LPFPASPRVVYEKNPLVVVICQLRFPPILLIDAELPARYQDRIRGQYPLLEEKPGIELPPEVPKIFAAEFGQSAWKNYNFSSTDGSWTVNLTRDFLALTARKYQKWEEFWQHLAEPLAALVEIYKPVYFTRLGLRYQDVIRRSSLGLVQPPSPPQPWSDLLEPYILGPLARREIAGETDTHRGEFRVALPDSAGSAHVRHGLMRLDGEECYAIDTDFYDERQTQIGDAHVRLDNLKRQAGRLFRWCIKDSLHRALGPREIPEGA
jgi:uncharacterized protein (TIGR04255 family)